LVTGCNAQNDATIELIFTLFSKLLIFSKLLLHVREKIFTFFKFYASTILNLHAKIAVRKYLL